MKIGIVDADLIGRKKHRFPNLASMKISGYYKELGNEVKLLLNYEDIKYYDKVFISKVFTDTPIDKNILKLDNVEYGGTGFFYDKAKPLPCEIEHHMPDYHLYDEWVQERLNSGEKRKNLEYYLDHSIGYSTRGCFRQCSFCVNKNYKKVLKNSSINEFLDKDRKYICLLDDNILGYSGWKDIFNELNSTGKKFQFKQGMDERLLTDEKAEIILNSNYYGDYIFAFDNIEDKNIIIEKLKIWNNHRKTKGDNTKFYVLCGYDRENKYDYNFWIKDIEDTFERIKILNDNGCLPYIMRYKEYENSPYRGTYINLSAWCNQPSLFRKMTYREFCVANQNRTKTDKLCSQMRYMLEIEKALPNISKKYFDIKFDNIGNKYNR